MSEFESDTASAARMCRRMMAVMYGTQDANEWQLALANLQNTLDGLLPGVLWNTVQEILKSNAKSDYWQRSYDLAEAIESL